MIENSTSNNKRIAKNTIVLYFRLIITTIVSLYTARLTLRLLGIEDFGIYNVVAGIIGFMGVLTATMSSASQRFLSFDLGSTDKSRYPTTYSMLVNIFGLYALAGIILLELVGPFVIYYYLNIPDDRQIAAQIVFQFTILQFALNTIIIPQNSAIISHEKMNVYAYLAIFDVVFKLLTVFALYYISVDRLITFAILSSLASFFTDIITLWYCKHKLQGCVYSFCWDKELFSKMMAYSGWNLFGSVTQVLTLQGQAIILNIFFGPIINAAKSIADKVNYLISSLSSNFFSAVAPQIIKSYASDNIDYLRFLVVKSSKFAYYLLLCINIPLIILMKPVLDLWLGVDMVTDETVVFSQLILVFAQINSLEAPITFTIRATGDIKKYQIYVGLQTLLFLPLCIISYLLGAPAYSSLIILNLIYISAHCTRVIFLVPILQITVSDYIRQVFFPVLKVTVISVLLSFAIKSNCPDGLFGQMLTLFLIIITSLMTIILLGITPSERKSLLMYVRSRNKA